jgi:hypothetical protein
LEHVFLYQHTMRTEWGYGAVTDSEDDRTTFKFDDGVVRTIKRDHIHLMVRVELEEPQNTDVRKRLARPIKSAAAAAIRKAAAATKKKIAKRDHAPVVIEDPSAADA